MVWPRVPLADRVCPWSVRTRLTLRRARRAHALLPWDIPMAAETRGGGVRVCASTKSWSSSRPRWMSAR